jgi:hypothetical protein
MTELQSEAYKVSHTPAWRADLRITRLLPINKAECFFHELSSGMNNPFSRLASTPLLPFYFHQHGGILIIRPGFLFGMTMS